MFYNLIDPEKIKHKRLPVREEVFVGLSHSFENAHNNSSIHCFPD